MILVDTSVWSLALRRRPADLGAVEQTHVREWERLVREGVAALIGPIRQELLSGVRDGRVWGQLRNALRAFPDLPLCRDDYEHAAQLFNQCRASGVSGGAVDFMICAASLRYAAPIYTTDGDFRHYARIIDVALHAPRARDDGDG